MPLWFWFFGDRGCRGQRQRLKQGRMLDNLGRRPAFGDDNMFANSRDLEKLRSK
jgi:hypothetical protein